LHDGAQQQLLALSIEIQLARDAVTTDPGGALAALDRAGSALDEAIDELAALAHGIYPPVLRNAGLAAALQVAAARRRPPARLTVTGVRRHAPWVEAAVYFAVLEGLQNAAKYAPGATVDVLLAEVGDRLSFVVEDDGPGFAPDRVNAGHGMLNIHDRIGAVGGIVAWESAPDRGTQMQGYVPLADSEHR
jgi:signal transduction histidine kinase